MSHAPIPRFLISLVTVSRPRRDHRPQASRSAVPSALVLSLAALMSSSCRSSTPVGPDGDDLEAANDDSQVGALGSGTNSTGTENNKDPLPSACGNGRIDPNETCDNSAVLPIGCTDLGFIAGQIRCNEDCSSYDLQGCHSCGDGIRQGPEKCDGNDLGGQSCSSVKSTLGGGPLGCTKDCRFDLSMCTGSKNGPGNSGKKKDEVHDEDPALCGNAKIDGKEDCDCGEQNSCAPEQLNGKDCEILGFEGGELGCLTDQGCMFDTRKCWHCGDGIRTGSEKCDGKDLGGQSCQSLGLGSGRLGCTADCDWDPINCEKSDPIEWYELCLEKKHAPVSIPDGAKGLAITFRNSRKATLNNMQVLLDIEHTQVGDLKVEIERDARKYSILTRPGRSSANPRGCEGNNIEVLLTDTAKDSVDERCENKEPALSGELRPTESFEGFLGKSMLGSWKVLVWDQESGETGSVRRICLRFR